jgi:hypothetical protein
MILGPEPVLGIHIAVFDPFVTATAVAHEPSPMAKRTRDPFEKFILFSGAGAWAE